MTVIVVRRDDTFSQMLRDAGIGVVNLELIGTQVLKDLSEFENLMSRLDGYDGVFFTSPVAAQVFVDQVKPQAKPSLYALGKRAATVLETAGFKVIKVPLANTAEEMLAAFGNDDFAGKKLLFVRGERSMPTIPETLAGIAEIDEVAVYRTIEIEPTGEIAQDVRDRFAGGDVEWVCFFSPSGIEAFEKRFGATDVKAGAIGETTAARARELGFRVEMVASRASNDTFATDLTDRIKGKHIV